MLGALWVSAQSVSRASRPPNNRKGNVTKRSDNRKAFLHGVFTTAMEGGIGYWSAATAYHWGTDGGVKVVSDLDGFYADIVPSADEGEWGVFDGDEDKKALHIDIDVIARGVTRFKEWMAGEKRNQLGGLVKPDAEKAWLRDPYAPTNRYWKQFLLSERTNGDDGDYDADVADAIVQLALFDEVVYG